MRAYKLFLRYLEFLICNFFKLRINQVNGNLPAVVDRSIFENTVCVNGDVFENVVWTKIYSKTLLV